jgi:hypothetical protein
MMATFSRRGLIKQTSLGAATAGALFAAPTFVHAASAASALAVPMPREPLAAYVHNAASGEISLLVGQREVIIHDPELVRRLVQAAL